MRHYTKQLDDFIDRRRYRSAKRLLRTARLFHPNNIVYLDMFKEYEDLITELQELIKETT